MYARLSGLYCVELMARKLPIVLYLLEVRTPVYGAQFLGKLSEEGREAFRCLMDHTGSVYFSLLRSKLVPFYI